ELLRRLALPTDTRLDDPHSFFTALAHRLQAMQRGGIPDTEHASRWLVQSFRDGKLGRWTLDGLGRGGEAVDDQKDFVEVALGHGGDRIDLRENEGDEDEDRERAREMRWTRTEPRRGYLSGVVPGPGAAPEAGPPSQQGSSASVTPAGTSTPPAPLPPAPTVDASQIEPHVSGSVTSYITYLTSLASSVDLRSAHQSRKAKKADQARIRDFKRKGHEVAKVKTYNGPARVSSSGGAGGSRGFKKGFRGPRSGGSGVARNEEKAQSMLYRFREAQAAELGLVQKTDRRPRLAAHCKDLRQCERWRGEILREISRKVSKIQDAGLTDYEVRDLNDQINKLLREKFHWENQIVALGGANYRRATGKITDADGREVPGQRGYKYFGRARDLPGVKELFATAKKDQSEVESYKTIKVTMFDNAPPEYFGNTAEQGEEGRTLLEAERKAEQAAWDEAVSNLEDEIEGAPTSLPLPSRHRIPLDPSATASPPSNGAAAGKRKAPAARTGAKKAKLADGSAGATPAADGEAEAETEEAAGGEEDAEMAEAGPEDDAEAAPGGFESIFSPEQLQAPKLLTAQEMEKAIVQRQKAILLEEYGVEKDE
ncbi:hypothetical protein JCM3774_003083, partial [Rhodotorula dairenensis]